MIGRSQVDAHTAAAHGQQEHRGWGVLLERLYRLHRFLSRPGSKELTFHAHPAQAQPSVMRHDHQVSLADHVCTVMQPDQQSDTRMLGLAF